MSYWQEGTAGLDVIGLEDTEGRVVFQKILNLLFDHTDIGTEIFRRKTNFDEFLLFHKYIVRDVVYDILAEDRSGQVLWDAEINCGHLET